MIKRLLASALLSGAVPAFAADDVATDRSFQSVAFADADYADYSGGSMLGWVASPSAPLEARDARSDIVMPVASDSSTMAMIMAGVVGFAGLSARRGRGN